MPIRVIVRVLFIVLAVHESGQKEADWGQCGTINA